MLTHFDDFCLWVYLVIDAIWQEIGDQFTIRVPNPPAAMSNASL